MKSYAIAVMIMMSDACDALDILNDCGTVFVRSVMTVMFVSYPYPYNRVVYTMYNLSFFQRLETCLVATKHK